MNFILRRWAGEDASALVKYASNKKIAANLRDGFPYPYTMNDAWAFLQAMISADEAKSFCRAIDIGGESVGSIGIFFKDNVYRKSAEIGYWLGEPFWGNGITTAAIRLMCGEAFERRDIVRIYAEPYAHNAASRRALTKAGFELEGVLRRSVYKNGSIFDSCIYALLKDNFG